MKTESENKVAYNPIRLDQMFHMATLSFKGLPPRNKSDKAEARCVELRENMAEGSFHASKALIGKDCLKVFDSAKKELMDHYYSNSIPPAEGKNSYVLVPHKGLSPFTIKMGTLKKRCEDAFMTFLRDYGYEDPQKREEWLGLQRSRLGGKFNVEDYPEPNELLKQFKIVYETKAFGDIAESAGSWVDHETLSQLKKQQNENAKVISEYASMAVWERLTTPLRAIVERLSEPDAGEAMKADGTKGFKDSLVTNLRDIVEKLPVMNFKGDKRLEDIRVECLGLLKDIESPKALRASKDKKTMAKQSTEDILKKVEGYGVSRKRA